MESTQFWGFEKKESIETAVDSALETLGLVNKKVSQDRSVHWWADNVQISLSVFSSVRKHTPSPGVAGTEGDYQLSVFPFNKKEEYGSTIRSLYEELQKTLAKPVTIYSRMAPDAGWYLVK